VRFAAAILVGLTCLANGDGYRWPLDLPPVLTSSFAEYRPGRYHAGIDLRTAGVGREVYAPADGYVSRVRVSPWGYGKALYLQLDDGNTVVFAHLSRFSPAIEDYVRQVQHKNRDYSVNLFPQAGEFRIAKGQVVAWSGQTGIGFPHLHYELRDESQQPFNPRLAGVDWPDTIVPVLRSILVTPSGPASSVNGDIIPFRMTPHQQDANTYWCDPVRASGRIGFAVDVTDPSNEGNNSLGIHRARVTVGGEVVFALVNDRLSYDTINSGAVSYHPFFIKEGPYLCLWRWRGNATPAFNQGIWDGWWDVGQEPEDVVISLSDFAGNEVTVTIPLLREEWPRLPETVATENGGNGRVTMACYGEYVVLSAEFPAAEPTAPILVLDDLAPEEGGQFHRVSTSVFRAGYLPAADAREVTFSVIHERLAPFTTHLFVIDSRPRRIEEQGVVIDVPPDSAYGTLFASVQEAGLTFAAPLPVRGRLYRIWPDSSPLKRPVRIRFPRPIDCEDLTKVHVYRAADGVWRWYPTTLVEDGLAASSDDFGVFALMEDAVAPRISGISPVEGQQILSRRPAIKADIADRGSGIKEITVTCGDQWLLMEYDPERGVVQWLQDEDLPRGTQRLMFTVSDRAGNETRVTRIVEIP